jgi:hypothetical protein
MSYHITKDGKLLSSDSQGLLIPDDTDRTPLVEWLRNGSMSHATTGSKALFGVGEDTDYLINIDELPPEIRNLVPPLATDCKYDPDAVMLHGAFDYEYDPDTVIIHDDFNPLDGKVDYIIGSPERAAEFKFATKHLASIRRDPHTSAEIWNLLKANKPLRIAIFRALRHAAPTSTLNY